MTTLKKFEELDIWKQAREFNLLIFNICNTEPFTRDYSLKDQIRRASGSIMNNIAEGFERGGNKEFVHFLYISKGSCSEVRSQLYQALDFKYIQQDKFDELYNFSNKLSASIHNMIRYLSTSEYKGTKYH